MTDSPIDRIEMYIDAAGGHRWHAIAHNGRILADSGEAYENMADCRDMVSRLFPDSPIVSSSSRDVL